MSDEFPLHMTLPALNPISKYYKKSKIKNTNKAAGLLLLIMAVDGLVCFLKDSTFESLITEDLLDMTFEDICANLI